MPQAGCLGPPGRRARGAAELWSFLLLVVLLAPWGSRAQDQALETLREDSKTILLKQAAAFTNWEEVTAAMQRSNLTVWSMDAPLCQWAFIFCGPPDSSDLSYLLISDRTGTVVSAGTAGIVEKGFGLWYDCWYYTEGSCVALEGRLIDELADLPLLNVLYIDGHRLTGSLPAAWGKRGSFPYLAAIFLRGDIDTPQKALTGSLPNEWGTQGSFPLLEQLHLIGNQLTGTLPAGWASAGAFPLLNTLNLGGTFNLTAPQEDRVLPSSWVQPGAFRSLTDMLLSENGLRGTLPATMPAQLQTLDLNLNQLTGTLPEEWGQLSGSPPVEWSTPEGPLFYAQYLILSNNSLTGSLPASYGNPGAFPNLTQIELAYNPQLSSSIPASWAEPGALPQLLAMSLDGTSVCGGLPQGLTDLQTPVCSIPGCVGMDCNSCIAAPCPAPAPSPSTSALASPSPPPLGEDGSSSSTPVGAIVGGVVGGVVALASGLALLALRRRKKRHAAAAQGKGKLSSMDPEKAVIAANAVHFGGADSARPSSDLVGSPAEDQVLSFLATHLPQLRKLAANSVHSAGSGSAPNSGSKTSSGSKLSTAADSGSLQAASGSGSLPSTAPSGSLEPDVQRWEVQWEELRLGRLIGKGSFGRVYVAMWNEVPVAAKLLMTADECSTENFLLPEAMLRDLQAEAAVLARMRHQNIVSLLGLCMVPPCILTEYCARGSLLDVLKKATNDASLAAQLTWPRRLRMALDAALGLLYLHNRRPAIIHRDVKTPNFLVDEHFRVKITDFGLAKVFQDTTTASQAANSSIATNPIWLAPEVMKGARPGAPSDVYSFALCMWELLTWRLPWHDADGAGSGAWPFRIYHMVLSGERPAIPALHELPSCQTISPEGLETYCQIMRECWADNPLERPGFDTVVPRLKRLLLAANASSTLPQTAGSGAGGAGPTSPSRGDSQEQAAGSANGASGRPSAPPA